MTDKEQSVFNELGRMTVAFAELETSLLHLIRARERGQVLTFNICLDRGAGTAVGEADHAVDI